jgi:hypothetical protein
MNFRMAEQFGTIAQPCASWLHGHAWSVDGADPLFTSRNDPFSPTALAETGPDT